MARELPTKWPRRPAGFYEDWAVFCREALSARLRRGAKDDSPAAILLAGSAILGAAGMVTLIQANKDTLGARGKEWGIEDLGKWTGVGGALLGAAVGGLGVVWLMRLLGRHADTAEVDALQARLAAVRREFEALRQDRAAGRLDAGGHQLAVERLFHELSPE